MLQLAQFAFDCIVVLESLASEGRGLTRGNIRHALSMMAPLGTKSDEIDLQCEVICETLEKTGLVFVKDGTYFARSMPDNLSLN